MSGPARGCGDIAPLVPWHVNGTLGEEERPAVAAHLAGCAPCRELAERAGAFRELAHRVAPDRFLDHVQARVLVEFVETPAAIDTEARAWIETHLAACDPCRGAAAILRELQSLPAAAFEPAAPRGSPAGARAATGAASFLARFWDRLARTVLQPVPALVYLVVAILALPALRQSFGPGRAARPPGASTGTPSPVTGAPAPGGEPPGSTARPEIAEVLPVPQTVGADLRVRGGSQGQPAPVVLRATAGRPLLIEIDPDLDRSDLRRRENRFRVEVRLAGGTIFEAPCAPADFDQSGRLRLLIPAPQVPADGEGEVILLRFEPGSETAGEILFRRSIRLIPAG